MIEKCVRSERRFDAVMAPPYSVPAEDKGFHSLAFLGEEVPDAPTINGIITSDNKIRTRPSEVRRMVRAALKSVDLCRQKKDLAVAFLAAEFNLDPATAKKIYANASAMLTPNGGIGLDKVRDVLNLRGNWARPLLTSRSQSRSSISLFCMRRGARLNQVHRAPLSSKVRRDDFSVDLRCAFR